jgi:hypothetical protein
MSITENAPLSNAAVIHFITEGLTPIVDDNYVDFSIRRYFSRIHSVSLTT